MSGKCQISDKKAKPSHTGVTALRADELDFTRFRRHISVASHRTFVTVGNWPKAAIPNCDGSTVKLRSGGQGIPERMISETGIHTRQTSALKNGMA